MTDERSTYDPHYFGPLAAAEERHFWFRARAGVIAAAVARTIHGNGDGALRLLEVGCGTGGVLRSLARVWPDMQRVGCDLFCEGLAFARGTTPAALVTADLHHLPFDAAFDLVGAFDVIEHLDDDVLALRQLSEVLRPGGRVVVTVPASRRLWSTFDEAAHHRRRYEPQDLQRAIERAGLVVEQMTPFMMGTLPLVWLSRRFGRDARDGKALTERQLRVVPGVNGVLLASLAWERWAVARGVRLPWGSSLLAVARRGDC